MPHPDSSTAKPGYNALLKRRRYLHESRERITDPAIRKEFATLATLRNKATAYQWLRKHGHPTASHKVYDSIADALRGARRDRFVLKPVVGHGGKGVYLLTRDGARGYACAMTGLRFNGDADIAAHFRNLRRRPRDRPSKEMIFEECLEDSLGFDVPLAYKVYAFAAGAPFVLQLHAPAHLPPEERGTEFYDEAGTRLGRIRAKAVPGDRWNMRPPGDLPQMFALAKSIVAQARVSFVRIEFRSTTRGVVVGGFSALPDPLVETFVGKYDASLGELWARSLDDLGLGYLGDSWKQPSGPAPVDADEAELGEGVRHRLLAVGADLASGLRRIWSRR